MMSAPGAFRYYGTEHGEPLCFMCGISSEGYLRSDISLDVQVFSDVIRPWYYVGKRRLERTSAVVGRQDVQVRRLPFRLNPNMPREKPCDAQHQPKVNSTARTPLPSGITRFLMAFFISFKRQTAI